MRYLGNKVLLLPQIWKCARQLGFRRGTVCDLFAGTGVVGAFFRARGNRVLSTDLMVSSWVFQKVFLETERPPSFHRLRRALDLPGPAPADRVPNATEASPRELRPILRVVRYLEEELEPRDGIISRQFSPAGAAGRMYWRPEVARHIDAILLTLSRWRQQELITETEELILLAATIDATDRLANISGTYGAFLKSWQSNTRKRVELRLPRLVRGPLGEANRLEAADWLPQVKADLLYIDPPYNHRQYPANYHPLEIVARIPRESKLDALEASIYGKSGLIPWKDQSSRLCLRRGTTCREAFRELLESTRIPRVIISYSEEGIITKSEFEEMLAEYASVPRSRLNGALTRIPYARFRSDADGRVSSTGAGRTYKTIPGRTRDEVHEWLFAVRKKTR